MIRILALLAACLLTAPAFSRPVPRPPAEPACGERVAFAAALAQGFGEMPAAMGIWEDGNVMGVLVEVYANMQTGTWTMLTVGANGTACVVGSGQMWEQIAAPKPGEEL